MIIAGVTFGRPGLGGKQRERVYDGFVLDFVHLIESFARRSSQSKWRRIGDFTTGSGVATHGNSVESIRRWWFRRWKRFRVQDRPLGLGIEPRCSEHRNVAQVFPCGVPDFADQHVLGTFPTRRRHLFLQAADSPTPWVEQGDSR